MTDQSRDRPSDAPLNPALKQETETVYDTELSSPAPIDTASAKERQGEGWPVIWLVVTALCVVLAVYFLL